MIFTQCVQCLIGGVKNLVERYIFSVYFSADVDLDGLAWSNSVTYANWTDVRAALKAVFKELRPLTWRNLPAPRGTTYDLVVIGIIDRVEAMKADYFISGPPNCARGGSNVHSIAGWRIKSTLDKVGQNATGEHGRNC